MFHGPTYHLLDRPLGVIQTRNIIKRNGIARLHDFILNLFDYSFLSKCCNSSGNSLSSSFEFAFPDALFGGRCWPMALETAETAAPGLREAPAAGLLF
jgi:hypothetical protein